MYPANHEDPNQPRSTTLSPNQHPLSTLSPNADPALVAQAQLVQPLSTISSRSEQPHGQQDFRQIGYNQYPISPPAQGLALNQPTQLGGHQQEPHHLTQQQALLHLEQQPVYGQFVPVQAPPQVFPSSGAPSYYIDPRTNIVWQAVPQASGTGQAIGRNPDLRSPGMQMIDSQPPRHSSVGSGSHQSADASPHQPLNMPFTQHGQPVIQTQPLQSQEWPSGPPGSPIQFMPPAQNMHPAQWTNHPPTTMQQFASPTGQVMLVTQGPVSSYSEPPRQLMPVPQQFDLMQPSHALNTPQVPYDGRVPPEFSIPLVGPSQCGVSLVPVPGGQLQMQTSAMWVLPNQANAMPASAPRLSIAQATDVKLEISAKNLVNRDTFSKSDPIAVVFEQVHTISVPKNAINLNGVNWVEVGRTERLRDNLNPHFLQQVSVPFYFEELQNMRIALWDVDGDSSELSKHDFLGEAYVSLGELVSIGRWSGRLSVSSQRDTWLTRAARKQGLGTLTIHTHEVMNCQKMAVDIVLRARDLSRIDLFGKSDPYVIITRKNDKGDSKIQLGKSEVVKKTQDPFWRPLHFRIDVPEGGRKEDISLNLEVFARGKFSFDSEIGSVEATLATLESSPKLDIVHTSNRIKGNSVISGTLIVESCSSMNLPSFLNYLQGGLHLHFSVAVDLTQSNGDPSKPESLHYRQSSIKSNSYMKALTAVWKVIEPYFGLDSAVAAFGFGAKINGAGSASHCFNLGLGPTPLHRSLDDVVASYCRTLDQVQMYGPTNLAPVIRQAMEHSRRHRQSQESMNYDIMLILTDGSVSDFDATVDVLIDASMTCPLSVVIVGIGNDDFSKMEELDSDNELLASRTDPELRARRDIVQFVPYRRFEKGTPEQLAAHLLAEVPDNIVEYFTTLLPPLLPAMHDRSFLPMP